MSHAVRRYNSGKNKQELPLLTVGRPPPNSPPAAAKVSYLKVNNTLIIILFGSILMVVHSRSLYEFAIKLCHMRRFSLLYLVALDL